MTRGEFVRGMGLAAAGLVSGCGKPQKVSAPHSFLMNSPQQLRLPREDVAEPMSFMLIGDTHFGFHDERDDAYADFYKRMANLKSDLGQLEKALKRAKDDKVDLIVCVGDNISFPTLANVETFKGAMDACGIPWIYTAGNHDWHFEGDSGSDLDQRARWTEKRLLPLYQGENPLCYSKVVKGVRFVMIDNSAYHVLPEQLAFWRQEAAKGDPVALCMHIPLWVDGFDIFTCGHPKWGTATDKYFEIERRQRWSEKLMPSTYEFREAVLSTPSLVGVFVGHKHMLQVAQANGGALMFTVPANFTGASIEVEIVPSFARN